MDDSNSDLEEKKVTVKKTKSTPKRQKSKTATSDSAKKMN